MCANISSRLIDNNVEDLSSLPNSLNVSLKDKEGSGGLVSDFPHSQAPNHWHSATGALAMSLCLWMTSGRAVRALISAMHLSFDTVRCQTWWMLYVASASSSQPPLHCFACPIRVWCCYGIKWSFKHPSPCPSLLCHLLAAPSFVGHSFHYPIPIWCCYCIKQRSDSLGHIPPPLLTHSATPLPYFTHPPSFDAPTTFLPPLVCFSHLIPVQCCQTTFKQPGTHSSPPPTASFGCLSPLFHPPASIWCSNNLPTPSDLFCPPHPCSLSPNNIQVAWHAFFHHYPLIRPPLWFVSPTCIHSMYPTKQPGMHSFTPYPLVQPPLWFVSPACFHLMPSVHPPPS